MLPSNGPPVQNTCAAQKACNTSVHEPQNTPPSEDSLTPNQESALTHPESLAPIEESLLTSIAGAPGNESNRSERDLTLGDNAPSEHDTVCGTPGWLGTTYPEQEQSYTTAHGSFSRSADSAYFAMPSEVCQDKGKGCAHSTPFYNEGNPSCEGDRHAPLTTIEEWEQFGQEIEEYSHSLSQEVCYSRE
jgi:hypothetical protein